MATTPRSRVGREVDYPTSDGRPMAETDLHRQVMIDLIETLRDRYADEPMVYVSGDLLLFYEEGNRRKHVAPDVFVVLGVAKLPPRDHYLLWEEGRAPDVVIEVTSKTTRREDQTKKLGLYRDTLRVPEYFQFDPTEDYLRPPFQGFRLVDGRYEPIEPIDGRLPCLGLGLHLERHGTELRLYDPASGRWLPTPAERAAQAEARAIEVEARTIAVEAENERLRREVEELRRRLSGGA
jgi:Uma2 family endonuclease